MGSFDPWRPDGPPVLPFTSNKADVVHRRSISTGSSPDRFLRQLLYRSATITSASRARALCRELAIKQVCSARSSNWRALATSVPAGTVRRANVVKRVNCDTRSTRSSTPSTRQSSCSQSQRDRRAIGRKLRIKQLTRDAHKRVSGDQMPGGPSNSGGGAVSRLGSSGELTPNKPAFCAAAEATYLCG